jgi:tight adherence protein C
MAVAYAMTPSRATAIESRIDELTLSRDEEVKPRFQSLFGALRRLGEKAPKSPKEMGSLRLRLVQAGYRGDEALTIFFGIRVTFALLLFALFGTSILMRPNILMALAALGLGYVLPGMVLARLAKRRAHRIRLSLADALDLLVVSVEAGLGLDQALTRVGSELAFAYPELSDELRLINLELRAGKPRAEALRNLADRTGVDDLSSLVTMLIQTDKFGTSVAQSLRVHSETLRTKRRQRAEEAAAKTGVKMVFPLVTCIFPAIWVVTIGPAAIRMVLVLFPMVEQMK